MNFDKNKKTKAALPSGVEWSFRGRSIYMNATEKRGVKMPLQTINFKAILLQILVNFTGICEG